MKNLIIGILSIAVIGLLITCYFFLDGWVRNSYNEGYVTNLKKDSIVFSKLIEEDLTKEQVLKRIRPLEYNLYKGSRDWDGNEYPESIKVKYSGIKLFFNTSGKLVRIDSMFLNDSPIYTNNY